MRLAQPINASHRNKHLRILAKPITLGFPQARANHAGPYVAYVSG